MRSEWVDIFAETRCPNELRVCFDAPKMVFGDDLSTILGKKIVTAKFGENVVFCFGSGGCACRLLLLREGVIWTRTGNWQDSRSANRSFMLIETPLGDIHHVPES